ncbi:MAG: hypothetical protein A3J97_07905 [Spirochaetes bacterium RIFOXYC1_FULL_54_7]|nr:MAG: hypothetical protein A3J97_07905 [Spirochaetes bacterium RIFOXYC1_FULL_54_7]
MLPATCEQFVDKLHRNERTRTHTWTIFCFYQPGLSGFDYPLPKWIGGTLQRSCRIDRTSLIPEDAIKAICFQKTDGKSGSQINSPRKFNQKIPKGKPCGVHKAQNIIR